MISPLLISSGRLWLALLMLYIFAMVYGLLSLTGANVERETTKKFEPLLNDAPVYEDDLLRISSYNENDEPNLSFEGLRHLPIDFPLARGLAMPKPGLRAGVVRKNATVAIGIPSIKREGHDYLVATVESLIKNLTPEQKRETVFIIFLGETDYEFLDRRVIELREKFQPEMDDGTLEVISPSKNLYPDWSKSIRSTFGDSLERVKWRSKQNLDQVFLMMHIYHLRAKYYLMMEDDVIASKEYMKKLLLTVKMKENTRTPWIYISFCGLGAIGKLFRRRTLPSYASFIHTFWNAKPLDWLQIDFARSRMCSYDEPEKTCWKRLKSVLPETHPSLFQHVGKYSSLPGKIQKLRDTRFKN